MRDARARRAAGSRRGAAVADDARGRIATRRVGLGPRARWLPIAAILQLAIAAPALALDEAELRALEARCEAARAAALESLRAARIAECKSDRRNDAAFCERYWRDLGNAVRTADGRRLPRLFDDLPECVAAHEARRGWVRP